MIVEAGVVTQVTHPLFCVLGVLRAFGNWHGRKRQGSQRLEPIAPAVGETADFFMQPEGKHLGASEAGEVEPVDLVIAEAVAGEVAGGGDDGEADLFKGGLGSAHVIGGGDEDDLLPTFLLGEGGGF